MQLADGSHVMVSVVGEDGDGNVVVSFDGGETQVSMRREDVQGMVDLARAQRWELLLDNDEQEEAKATGEDVSPVEGEAVPSATTEGAASRGFELNDVVEVRGENGQMVQGYVTRPMNEDGLYEVFTDSSVGGLRSAYYAPEDMRLVEAKGVEGLREGAQEGEDGTLQGEDGRDERPSLMDAVRTLYEKGKDAAKQFARTFFDVARTPEFMKGVGLTGDRFTVRYGVLARHFGKDSAHDLPMEVWEQLPDALQKPFAISEYYTDEDKQQQKGYRIYTRLQLADGSHVMVSAEVKNAGRDVEVNAINTVFGRSVISDVHEKLVYVGNELTPEQQALLDGTTPHQYPDARGQGEEGVPSSEGKDSVSSGNGQGNVGENVIEMPMRRVKRKIEGQMVEVDEEDFEAVSPERTADYLYNEEQSGISREQADDFVGAKIAENEKVVKGIEARKPRKGASPAEIRVHKGKVEAELAEAVPHLEYWRSVAAARDAVKEREIAAANERYRQERAAKEEAKRAAEVQRKEENGVGAAVRERWLNAPKVEGNADELTLANGEHVGGRYVLVESGAVSASHQATNGFARTEGFPMDENGGTVNDRDYERDGDAQRVTREIAQDYDARALQSPVVVSGDGVVLSGNGRTMAGELAALEGTDGAYVEHLKRYGAKYGFTREQVEGMQHPRVVFVLDETLPYTAETFAKFNARETKAQSKTEEAVKLGKVVDDGTFGRVLRVLGGFETLGEFYGDEGAVREVVGELANAGVVGRMDMGGLFDGEGVSVQGRELIENVLVGKAFEGDGDAVRRLTEMKSMRTSVVNALGEVLRNKSLGGAFDFMEELPKAVALVYEARKTGGYKVGDAVDGFALQYDMFGEGQTVADPTDVAVLLLANAINDKRNTRLKGVLASYNDLAEDAAMGQGDIFSGFAQNKQSILEDVMRILQLSTPLTTNEHELSQLRDEQREQETQETDPRAAEAGVGEAGASDEGLEDEPGGIGEASLSAKIAAAEGEVDTNPSDAQKEAGNYKKGHVQVGTFDISIEQPKGSVRRGVDANGKAWESKMHNTYGYFRGTEGVDGDHIDVFVSNDIDGWNGQKVFVVDQYNPDGTFDEHKVMLGFNDAQEAMSDYLANYEEGWKDGRRLDVSATNLEDFEKWLASSHRKTKPFGEYKGVKREVDEVDAALKKELQDFIAQTDTMDRTAMDESGYDAEELFAPLLLDGKPSPLAVMTSVSDDINDPSVQIAVYDYSQEIDEKTNSGWQKWGNLADEYNAQASEEDKGWERGDTAMLGFRSVGAAVKFYDWVQHRDGVKRAPMENEVSPKFQVSGERLKSDTEAKQLATDVVLSLLESADVPVEVVSDEVAAAVLPEHAQLHMVYHGSGAKFDKFDHSHMGEGEGAQAFGWGSYVTEVEEIGRAYAQGGNAIKFRGFVLEETHGPDVKEHFSKSERKVLSFLHKWIALSNDVEIAVEKAKEWASNEYRKYSGRRDWSDQDYKDSFGATSRNEVREWRKEMKEKEENARQMLAFIETLSVDDFSIPPRHLYTVEIPDDRGKNYLHWDQPVAGKEKERIRIALTKAVIGRLETSSPSERQALRTSISAEFRHNIITGQDVYYVASRYLSPMEASGLLSSLGYTGISHAAQVTAGERADGARNYAIFKEHDLKITNHVEFMKTSQGTVYGWTVDGKIYLTRAGLNPETSIHEYTHLWAGAMRERNAEGWKSIKDLLQGSPMWEEVMHDPNYSHIKGDEDAVASEVLSRISGKENAKRFEEEAKKVIDETRDLLEKARAVMLLNNVGRAVKQFWNWVGRHLFGIKRFASIDEVTDRVLYDLASKTNLKTGKGHNRSLIGVDNQGNLVDGEGRLVTEKVGSIDELRDEDFTSPSRSVELPELDARVADAIGTGGKPVVIKKNIFERNAKAHGDLTAADSRDILKAALYTPTLYGQNQKTKRPYNWVLIKTRDAEGENRVVLLEVNENKDNVEIVHWHYVRDNALETIKRQAVREGGPILILPSEDSEEAGGLSSRTNNLSSEGKVSESSKKEQGFDGKNGVIRLQKGDDGVAARDAAYADAVARGDMETAERMLAEEAARKGYMMESDYQGTSAFNGAAPSENGYYESLEERKAAFDEEDFEGDWSLADELVHGIEMGSLDFRLSDRELNHADRSRREAIQNLRNVRARVNAGEKDVRITMYRSVPAGVVEGEFRNGDWVTPSRLYAEENAAVHGGYPGWENGYRIIEQEVPIEDVWWDGNDIAEWGYDNGREEAYKNVANNRKSFSVTYDADGVLIPLSKRFDEGVSDVSYHKGDDVVVSAEDTALRDAVVELMRGAGIDVVVDSEEGQRVLDMENERVRWAMERKTFRSGRSIVFTRANPTTTLNALERGLKKEGVEVESHKARTGSRYAEFEKEGVWYKVRSANHTKALSVGTTLDEVRGMSGIELTMDLKDGERPVYGVEVDLSLNEMGVEDLRALMDEVERFNGSGVDVLSGERVSGFVLPSSYLGDEFPLLSGFLDDEVLRSDEFKGQVKEAQAEVGAVREAYEKETGKPVLDEWLHLPFTASNGLKIEHLADGFGRYVSLMPVGSALSHGIGRFGDAKKLRKEAFAEYQAAVAPYEARLMAWEESAPSLEEWLKGNEEMSGRWASAQEVLSRADGGARLHKVGAEEDAEGVNARFNDELSGLTEANADKVVLSLGRPSGILLSAGVEDRPMKLYGNKVMKKMRKHGFALEELRNLPGAVADPVAVFNNYGEVGNRSILTELRTKQGNFLVSVDIGKDADIDFNIVRSVFGKGDNSIVDWINKGLATYINKKKALTFLSHQSAPIAATAANAELSSAAKVVKDFENPKLGVEKRRFFRTEDGKAYGFTVDGKVYLDPRMAGVETAVHEYTHLWADALRRVNPEEWRNVVELMKGTSVWDEVKRNYPELESEDEIADEVLAHYSGRRGAERLRAALDEEMGKADGVFERAQVVSAFERVKRALARFWKGVADFLGVHFDSADEVADMVLGDLLRGRRLGVAEKGVSMVGRSLSAEEAKELVVLMEENAAPVRELELTRENWAAEFGADGVVQTPLGEVKMGEHQYEKLEQQGRRGKLGMVKPTLESPDVVIEDKSRAKGGEETERGSSYVFVRSFVNEEGKRQYFFTSVTVHRNNQEVVISNQEKTGKRISNLLQQGEIGWINEKYQPASETQGEEISLSQDNSWTDTSGDKNAVPLGVNLSETSAAKVDKSSENGKGEDIFSMAERIAEETKREQRARRNARYHREGGSVEYGQAVSRAAYEQRMASGAFQSREALQDSMLSLREAMDLILHKGEKGKGWRV